MRTVLVTGSRDLDDWELVYTSLRAQALLAGGTQFLRVRHGKAKGTDTLAERFCALFPEVTEDAMPADWNRECTTGCFHKPRFRNGQSYCPVAGNLRNQAMVDKTAEEMDAGDDVACLGFPRGEARGTNDCIRRARRAGIPVIIG